MFAWLKRAVALASSSKRSSASADISKSPRINFSATVLSRAVSVASYTSPMPPRPIRRTMRKWSTMSPFAAVTSGRLSRWASSAIVGDSAMSRVSIAELFTSAATTQRHALHVSKCASITVRAALSMKPSTYSASSASPGHADLVRHQRCLSAFASSRRTHPVHGRRPS